MAKIDPAFRRQLAGRPNDRFDIIIRTRGDATPYLSWLDSAGIKVTRQFKLTPGVAASCTGQDALQLLDQDWVLSVEPDAPVSTM